MIYRLGNRRIETVGDSYYIAPGAQLIGSVRIGRDASVWFNCVLRADSDWIILGDDVNVQDGSVLHTDEGLPLQIGVGSSVGHRVLLHGCTVGEKTLIGNGAMVLDGVTIGNHCLIAAGALIPPGKAIPDGVVVMGMPGKIVREVSEADLAMIRHTAAHYRSRGKLYRERLEVDPRSAA